MADDREKFLKKIQAASAFKEKYNKKYAKLHKRFDEEFQMLINVGGSTYIGTDTVFSDLDIEITVKLKDNYINKIKNSTLSHRIKTISLIKVSVL